MIDFKNIPGHRLLVGDFNALLGEITGDHASNSNKTAFLDFLGNHCLININVQKTFGQYTFHNISSGSRSIIDYLLTDMDESQIPVHVVLPGNLGTSAQSGHKALLSKVLIRVKKEEGNKQICRPRWRSINSKNSARFSNALKKELSNLSPDNCDYKALLAALNRAKTNSRGRARPKPSNACNPTPELDQLHRKLGFSLEEHRKNPTKENLLKAKTLEKQLP